MSDGCTTAEEYADNVLGQTISHFPTNQPFPYDRHGVRLQVSVDAQLFNATGNTLAMTRHQPSGAMSRPAQQVFFFFEFHFRACRGTEPYVALRIILSSLP